MLACCDLYFKVEGVLYLIGISFSVVISLKTFGWGLSTKAQFEILSATIDYVIFGYQGFYTWHSGLRCLSQCLPTFKGVGSLPLYAVYPAFHGRTQVEKGKPWVRSFTSRIMLAWHRCSSFLVYYSFLWGYLNCFMTLLGYHCGALFGSFLPCSFFNFAFIYAFLPVATHSYLLSPSLIDDSICPLSQTVKICGTVVV